MIQMRLVSKLKTPSLEPSKSELRSVALKVRKLFQDRTAKGLDVNYKRFDPYSIDYELKKQRQML